MIGSVDGSASSIQSILQNIRQIRDGFEEQQTNVGVVDNTEETSFQDTFQNAIKAVSESQMESASLKNAFEVGDPNVSLEQVTIASSRASVQFEAMLQVRNKLIDAYKEIMNMPV